MANDFSGDGDVVALYRFENGALVTDSKNSNDLTANGTISADTVNFQEGAAAADFDRVNEEYFDIADVAMSAAYPLKNGTSVETLDSMGNLTSFCFSLASCLTRIKIQS